MKKIFSYIFILVVFLSGQVYAQESYPELARLGTGVGGLGTTRCISTDIVGYSGTAGSSTVCNANVIRCNGLWTPSCSGTLGWAWVRHDNTGATGEHVKVGVFEDKGTAGTPDVNDTIVGSWSGVITTIANTSCDGPNDPQPCCTGVDTGTCTDDAWYTYRGILGGSVSKGNNYWVCLVSDSTAWIGLFYDSSSSGSEHRYIDTVTDGYTSPPSNLLGGDGWTQTQYRRDGIYVEVN